MIFEDLLLSVLDFAGISQFSIPLSFINGFVRVMAKVYQLNGFIPVLTLFKNVLLVIKFGLICGVVKFFIGKLS